MNKKQVLELILELVRNTGVGHTDLGDTDLGDMSGCNTTYSVDHERADARSGRLAEIMTLGEICPYPMGDK